MANTEKIIYVYDSFTFDEPKLLGKLFVNAIKGGESYSFEHDKEWLSSTNYPVSIDPDFMGYGGREYPLIWTETSCTLPPVWDTMMLQWAGIIVLRE